MKPTCKNCRFYFKIDHLKGYCQNKNNEQIGVKSNHVCPHFWDGKEVEE